MKDKIIKFIKANMGDMLFILALTLTVIIFTKNVAYLQIEGHSMYPTFKDKSMVMISKEKTIERGDIVVFTPPESWRDSGFYVKRIVGIEGDTLKLKGNTITLNGTVLNYKPFFDVNFLEQCTNKEVNIEIGKDEYFVMGDNFGASTDSFYRYCAEKEDMLISKDEIKNNGNVLLKIGGK